MLKKPSNYVASIIYRTIFLIFLIGLTNSLHTEFSCKNKHGQRLCYTGASGKIDNYEECSNTLINATLTAVTGELFPSLRNAFSEPLDTKAVEYIPQIFGCVTSFIKDATHAGESENKVLLQTSEDLYIQIMMLINTVGNIYNTTFAKPGIATVNAKALSDKTDKLKTVAQKVDSLEKAIPPLKKAWNYFWSYPFRKRSKL